MVKHEIEAKLERFKARPRGGQTAGSRSSSHPNEKHHLHVELVCVKMPFRVPPPHLAVPVPVVVGGDVVVPAWLGYMFCGNHAALSPSTTRKRNTDDKRGSGGKRKGRFFSGKG